MSGGDKQNAQLSRRLRVGDLVAATYRVVRWLGRGGTSEVFVVEHERLGRSFALKVLRPNADPALSATRFRREARALAALNSPYVVQVLDCGDLDGDTPYLVLELLEGQDLKTLLKHSGRLSVDRAIGLMIDICRGLASVHSAGLVHRDLKPENVFVTREAGREGCKILDFGVAKMGASQATAEGSIIGTVRYMAPEQLTDGAKVGPSTDIYAVGAMLYECLSGQPLHHGASVEELMYSVLNREPAALTALCSRAPDALCNLVARATAKQQHLRPQSADELRQQLGALACGSEPDQPTLADAPALSSRVGAHRHGRSLRPWLVGLSLLGVGWVAGRSTIPTAQGQGQARLFDRSAPSPTLQHAVSMQRSSTIGPTAGATVDAVVRPPLTTVDSAASTATAPAKQARAAWAGRRRSATGSSPLEGQFDQVDPYTE